MERHVQEYLSFQYASYVYAYPYMKQIRIFLVFKL